jgi:hypothetical protein
MRRKITGRTPANVYRFSGKPSESLRVKRNLRHECCKVGFHEGLGGIEYFVIMAIITKASTKRYVEI